MKKLKRIHYAKDKDYLFVDGYNIINSWEKLKNLSSSSLEDTRHRLIDILSEYSNYTGEEIILVFDGYMVKKSPGVIYLYNGIIIVYTKEHETADHFIERQLHEIGRYRNVRVATSDSIEQQLILSRGGTRISARELEMEVENIKSKIENKTKKLKEQSKVNINSLDDDILEKLKGIKNRLD